MKTLCEVLTVCQEKPNAFERGLEVARKVFADTPLDEFLQELERYLQVILPNTESSEYAERLVDFIARFVASPLLPDAASASREGNLALEENGEESNGATLPENKLVEPILSRVLEWSESGKKVVRERCCTFVDKLTSYLGNGVVAEDLIGKVEDAMLTRLGDRIGSVRSRAVGALSRLQQPDDPNCQIVQKYVFHLACDPCADVRAAILRCLVPSTRTLSAILQRARDTKEAVRKLAYERIAEKIPIKYMRVKQRIQILDWGLHDKSKAVRQVVNDKLIPAWFAFSNDKVTSLVRLLDVEKSEKVVEALLKALFQKYDVDMFVKDIKENLLDQDKIIAEDRLTVESALYWRCLVQHLHSLGTAKAEAHLDTIFPDLTVYCGYASKFVLSLDTTSDALDQLRHKLVSMQLVSLFLSADLADNAGRERLIDTVRRLFLSPKVDSLLIERLVKVLRHIFPQPEDTLKEVELLLPDIQAPLVNATQASQMEEEAYQQASVDVLVSKVKVQLNILREELEQSVEREDYQKAQETKLKIGKLEKELNKLKLDTAVVDVEPVNDTTVILKCLTLLADVMAATPLKSLNPFLQTCLEDIVVPGIVQPDFAIRKQAVRVLCYCCVLNKHVAVQHLKLLFEISFVDSPAIRSIALAGALDVLLVNGLKECDALLQSVFAGAEEDEESPIPSRKTSDLLVEYLTKCADHEDERIRSVAAEGMAKLQLFGHISSSELVTALILHWINPCAKRNTRFHHVLGAFLKTYSMGGPNNTSCFEEAFIPTLDAVLNAPASSPLAKLDPMKILNFLTEVTLLRAPDNPYEYATEEDLTEPTPHDRLAELLCREVLKDPNCEDALCFAKALTLLRLTQRCALSALVSAAEKMGASVKAHRTLVQVKRFKEKLTALASGEAGEMDSSSVFIESATTADSSVPSSASSRKRRLLRRGTEQDSAFVASLREDTPEQQPSSEELFPPSFSSS